MSKLEEVYQLVSTGKAKLVPPAVQAALDEGNDPTVVLNTMIDAMGLVGEKFKNNEIFVPEMLVAARAMKKGVEVESAVRIAENGGTELLDAVLIVRDPLGLPAAHSDHIVFSLIHSESSSIIFCNTTAISRFKSSDLTR